jgi:hypothetical protein
MCFSTTASFGAGILLTVIGIASIKKVQSKSQLMFASIPLIFAVQQFSEGFVWLALTNSFFYTTQQIATYTFLFFAQVLWPLWIPVAILLLEKEKKRLKIQIILAAIGISVAIYFLYLLISYNVRAEIIGYHIAYKQGFSSTLGVIGGVFYIIATIAPQFFSHVKRMWIFGVAILISYIVSTIFYEHYVVSVWCFFASIISLTVFATIVEIKKSYKKQIAL